MVCVVLVRAREFAVHQHVATISYAILRGMLVGGYSRVGKAVGVGAVVVAA